MAEIVSTAVPVTPVRAYQPGSPLGQGVAAPSPRDIQEAAAWAQRQAGSPRAQPSWDAGAGQGGHAGAALAANVVLTAGLRHKQLGQFAGAACANEQVYVRASQQAAARKAIKDVAGPYQKDAAIRAAQGALRPWSAITGLGERQGAKYGSMMVDAPANLKYGPDNNSPSMFQPPGAAHAAAISAAAEQVARPGSKQVDAPAAWAPAPGQAPRELWPHDMVNPPRYCVGCRGAPHEPSKELNPEWEPYTPKIRLQGLNAFVSVFQAALTKRDMCVALNDSKLNPVKWMWKIKDVHGDLVEATPHSFAPEDFTRQLAIMFEGLREGHEPYRHLATRAVEAFLATKLPLLAQSVPALIRPLRLAMQTYEPQLVGHALLMLQKLIRAHKAVMPALVPHLQHLLPTMAMFRCKHFVVHLPPPFCVGATGSFTGSGMAPEAGARQCAVCGCPVDKAVGRARARLRAQQQALVNPHLIEPLPASYDKHPRKGRWSQKYVLEDLINETLELFVQQGGLPALAAVQARIPRFCYYSPRD